MKMNLFKYMISAFLLGSLVACGSQTSSQLTSGTVHTPYSYGCVVFPDSSDPSSIVLGGPFSVPVNSLRAELRIENVNGRIESVDFRFVGGKALAFSNFEIPNRAWETYYDGSTPDKVLPEYTMTSKEHGGLTIRFRPNPDRHIGGYGWLSRPNGTKATITCKP